MPTLKTFFVRWWPFIAGFLLMLLFACEMRGQEKVPCQVTTQDETIRYADGKLIQQNVLIDARTDKVVLSHFETVKGRHGEIKWKELWKLRKKAEAACEEYIEHLEKQSATKGGDLPSRAANTPAP